MEGIKVYDKTTDRMYSSDKNHITIDATYKMLLIDEEISLDYEKEIEAVLLLPTGVKDINKKDAYLGDILKNDTKYDYGIIEKESESNNMFITWWYPSNSDCKLWNSMKLKLSYIKQFEVVGNVFENQDMIKKEV